MITYALHHDWHIKSTQDKLDAWHLKQLRRTMKHKTTYIDRGKTNNWILTQANSERLSTAITRRQIKYFAHIARHPDDITHTVCYGPPHIKRQLNHTRRVGRPRHHWTVNVETAATSAFVSAGFPVINRQHLFNLCSNRAQVVKMTAKGGGLSEAQHVGGGPSGPP